MREGGKERVMEGEEMDGVMEQGDREKRTCTLNMVRATNEGD
jgi:hypothetical protein